ncbi:NmrA family transcriptional regulator [Cryptosporangium minutisporangium]|uniref:NAD(P)H-binding protein n=1 Tax=Cryptosporangium minutisporangium TaxID=113569 RepID=A0ABP6SQC8_9ACTN
MTILLTAGNGKTGRRIAARLDALGIPVRLGSRSGTPPFDWADPATWPAALSGVDAAYVNYVPDLAVPDAPKAIETFTAEAARQGVRRLVLLSGRGETEAERCERIVQANAPEWTIVRCSWFAQNFSEDYLLADVLDGTIRVPVTDVREPFVDVDDIADVAVAALTDPRHTGQLYELTGPRALTFAEAAAEIAAASGRSVGFESVSIDDYAAGLRAAEYPEDVIWLVTYLFTEVLDGRNEAVRDGVQRALGRPAKDFAEYAKGAAESGAWAE